MNQLSTPVRRADGVVLAFSGPQQVRHMAQSIRDSAASAGRAVPDVVATCFVATPGDALAEHSMRAAIASHFAVPTYQRLARELAGDRVAASIAETLRVSGRAAAGDALPDRVIDETAAVATVAGLRSKIAAYVAAGATSVHVVPVRAGGEDDDVRAVIDIAGAVRSSTDDKEKIT